MSAFAAALAVALLALLGLTAQPGADTPTSSPDLMTWTPATSGEAVPWQGATP